jgi:hypothetical protein
MHVQDIALIDIFIMRFNLAYALAMTVIDICAFYIEGFLEFCFIFHQWGKRYVGSCLFSFTDVVQLLQTLDASLSLWLARSSRQTL